MAKLKIPDRFKPMKERSKKLAKLRTRLEHEFQRFIFYSIFLFIFLSAFIVYRRLLLEQYHITYTHYGFALFESLVLAKFILIGELLGLDKSFPTMPLIIPVLYNSLIFTFLVLVLTIVEHFFVGSLYGIKPSIIYHEFIVVRIYEDLANCFIMLFIFIPFFSILEIARIIGEVKLFNLFFRRRSKD
jgi:hypothetical protein